ncbi:hypothetical protein CHS0354_032894 [Potamilus streckersoni]|uniref:NACHT domain-containing protein n=1 Tax=Potamilus streckersoni TaxID=2493646 RepID=A0AAE0RW95_9BIVA|nr:hypothetical protein CHS0354_032894 [Potamilus streckersoni]
MTIIGLGALARKGYCLIAVNALFLVAGITSGTNEGRVEVCEFEDANLIFPNVPAGSVGDIRAKTWNKENGVLLASWMADTNFVTSHSYGDRLMAVGENGIKIRNATRSDTGTYTLVLTSGSKQDFIEFLVHLEVLVPPSVQCTPNITHEGNSLIAKLPSEVCGIPKLIPRWINRTQTLINGNINVLDIDPGIQEDIYVVCAVGESGRCFREHINYLCANYTKPGHNMESRSTLVTTVILPFTITPVLIIIGVILIVACYFRRKPRRKKSLAGEESEKLEMTDVASERQALIKDETSAKGLADIKRHLIHLYKTLASPDLSSSGNVKLPELSPVYFDLEITSLRVENVGDRGNVSASSLQDIVSIGKRSENAAKTVHPIPAVIIGKCGIGKSTWCKTIVDEWCSYNSNMESNLNVCQTTIPEVARFEILLFVPLKYKLEGHFFADCLRHELFHNDAVLFVNTMNYMAKHGESVIIIIDGLDEVIDNLEPIRDLLKSKETYPCTTVITSRPDGLECLQKKEEIKLCLFQMHGLNLVKAKEFASKAVGIHCGIYGNELSAEQLLEGLSRHQVQTLFQVPLLSSSLVLSWIHNTALLDNVTDFLLAVVECYVNHAKTRRLFVDNIDNVLKNNNFETKIKNKIYSREYGYILQMTSNVAKQILSLPKKNKIIQMTIGMRNLTRDIEEDCVQLCVETGILVKTSVCSKTKTVSNISFSNVLLFDFFAALSLAIGKRDSSSKGVKIEKVVMNTKEIREMLHEFDPGYSTRNY